MATCLNLINEDGALHPIHQPVVAEPNITLDDMPSRSLLKRRYGQRVDWQMGWADQELEAYRRQERSW